MTDRRAASADLATGVVLFALSVAMIYGSWTMGRLEIRQIHPLTAPGLLPGLLGIALGLCSLALIGQAVRARSRAIGAAGDVAAGSVRNLSIAAVLCLGYALGLVGRAPFWLATALFVFAFIFLFEWLDRGSSRQRLGILAWAMGIGLATGVIISYAFSELFLVRLP
ncbi:MAG TPA: tripartite tricarboxylate transporter TctB family protein [Methylomirabilota bacterium]|nr:tripartite tricarboxylate transporter TctB family protein [Methylomirabilota bacterium]